MRFNKLLHPEVVLNSRGPTFERTAYRKGFALMPPGTDIKEQVDIFKDAPMAHHMILARRFLLERPNVYYLPKDFINALSMINRSIPLDVLPKSWFGYLAFGDGALEHSTGTVEGVYVSIAPADSLGKRPEYGREQLFLWGSIVGAGYRIGAFGVPLTNAKISEIMLDTSPTQHLDGEYAADAKEAVERVALACLNAILYINSVGAEIERVDSHNHLRGKQRLRLVREGKATIANECTLPLTLVSYHYKKPVRYQVDSTWIDTHMRWQRCGAGHSQVKLIWVQSHERHYNKGEAASAPEGG